MRDAYDEIYAAYEAWDDDAIDDVRQHAFDRALSLVPARARALDLGLRHRHEDHASPRVERSIT